MSDEKVAVISAEEALGQLAGGYILDVATGAGGFINFLIENLKEYTQITGIDTSERSIDAARKSHPLEMFLFQRMDAAHMDFPNNHFDTVCMANSLHHMEDLPGVLTEMKRVCKPGGHIILCEMYQDGQRETQLTHVYLHHWWAAVDRAEGITHFDTYTRQRLVEIVDTMMLRDVKYFEIKDLEANPTEPELIQELDSIIDRFIQRAQTLKGRTDLCQSGEELRQRTHRVGFHGATSLLVIGEK